LSFRRKLLLLFSATVFVVVVGVAWSVSAFTRAAFERMNAERTSALVKQFQREFNRRGEEVGGEVDAIVSGDTADRMALELGRPQPDYGAYISEAKSLASTHKLDFLEFVDDRGTILSSAQWPAKFGYKDPSLNLSQPVPRQAYLKEEQLPGGAVLGLFAVRAVNGGTERRLYVAGGRRVDSEFLGSLDLPAGMRAMLYQNLATDPSAELLIGASGRVQGPDKLMGVIRNVLRDQTEQTAVIRWTATANDDETIHAIPLAGQNGRVAGVLLLGSSRKPYVELNRRIRLAALLLGSGGVLIAILISSWAARRVTRPVEQLAAAARSVAAGELNVKVEVSSQDELGELAEAFNLMTRDLLEQRDRLVQTERVAAWRELARRLAHELKNPLFPLQLTVENLVRAHAQSPEMFEEIFRESTATLLAEIANLKSTIGRFSEFSKMPQPKFQQVEVNDVVQQVIRVFQAQLKPAGKIDWRMILEDDLPTIAADAELLHRVISNLVLNAMDAMPDGGMLTVRTYKEDDGVRVEVSDTGSGLTPEECERLFTPYYTTKQHGTGLGLAIVQSIVTDHQGRVSVQSTPGRGTSFTVDLPRNWDKLAVAERELAKAGVPDGRRPSSHDT